MQPATIAKHRRHAVIVTALVSCLLVACGTPAQSGTPVSTATPSGSPAAIDPEAVRVGSALEQIRGHHQASLELYRAGDRIAAIAHASHPVAEIIDSIRSDLDDAGAATSVLEAALGGVVTTSQAESEADLAAAVATADRAVEDAADKVAAGAPATAYVGSVIANLLATAGHEYSEAIVDGAVAETIEYQDAYAFVARAHALYGSIAGQVETAAPEEAEEIDEAFEALAAALPGVQPPPTVASIDDVEGAAALIGHELAEVVGALPVSEVDPEAERAEIEELLDEVLRLVEAGQRDQAAELAAEIYLEHYEVIEPDVIAAAPEINAELEPLLGAGLRQQIRDGVSLAEITTSVERAKQLLRQAVEALEGH